MRKHNPSSKTLVEKTLGNLSSGEERIVRRYINRLRNELAKIKAEYAIKSQGHDYYVLDSIKEKPWEKAPASDTNRQVNGCASADADCKCPRCDGITMLPDGSECPDCHGKGFVEATPEKSSAPHNDDVDDYHEFYHEDYGECLCGETGQLCGCGSCRDCHDDMPKDPVLQKPPAPKEIEATPEHKHSAIHTEDLPDGNYQEVCSCGATRYMDKELQASCEWTHRPAPQTEKAQDAKKASAQPSTGRLATPDYPGDAEFKTYPAPQTAPTSPPLQGPSDTMISKPPAPKEPEMTPKWTDEGLRQARELLKLGIPNAGLIKTLLDEVNRLKLIITALEAEMKVKK